LDEQGLIQRAARGDVGAFNALVQQYQNLAYGVAHRALGDPEAAADATQDAFLSAYGAIGSFRGGSFKAWLLRIVTNACYDHGRRLARRPAASLDAIVEAPGGEDVLVDPAPLPESAALSAELIGQIEACLLELPMEQRTVVILADLHGLSYDEIAEATATSLGTVKSRLNRGRLHLRDRLLRRAPELSGRAGRPGT
jgi:RNA polymerase sigma-70 factor (ECF subfamily)